MLTTWHVIVLIILFKSLMGAALGLAASLILYRFRLTPGAFLGGIVLGALGFLIGAGLAGWGDSHSYFLNGVRMDQAPWGENLWLRNRLAENGTLLSVLFALLAVCVGYGLSRHFSTLFSRKQTH